MQKASHYMQTEQWAQLRAATGWRVLRLLINKQEVFAYRKSTPLGGVVYIPGFEPATAADLEEIARQVKTGRNVTCKIEPCAPLNEKAVKLFVKAGWREARHIQYSHTVRLDLAQAEDTLWMGMKSRGRQEVNYARRDLVYVRESNYSQAEYERMYDILKSTSLRKSFGVRERGGLIKFWETFHDIGQLRIFFAYHNDQAIACGAFVDNGQDTVWYQQAGSLPKFSKLFGPRLLLWEVALIYKAQGFMTFDLGGVPDPTTTAFKEMKGLYVFKTAFSREVTPMMPTYELPLMPARHHIWRVAEPLAIKANRLGSSIKGRIKGSGR